MPENKKPLCLVLGGSFNPPTKAHRDLLLYAISEAEKAGAQDVRGLLVPSSENYVSRKMSKLQPRGHVFPEQMRMDMLKLLCADTGMLLSDAEFGDDGRGHTYGMLRKIRDEDPDCEYRFVVGADKLRIIPRWHDAEKLLSEFGLAVTARDSGPEKVLDMIRRQPLLSAHARNIMILAAPPGSLSDVSSSAARACFSLDDWDGVSDLCGFDTAMMMAWYKQCGGEYRGCEAYKAWRYLET